MYYCLYDTGINSKTFTGATIGSFDTDDNFDSVKWLNDEIAAYKATLDDGICPEKTTKSTVSSYTDSIPISHGPHKFSLI